MALIRLSVLKDTAYAPAADGAMVMDAYRKRRLTGRMEALPESALAGPSSLLAHYLSTRIKEASVRLDDAQPAVILVHGFLFDPRQGLSPDPRETDNPHGRLYHFARADEYEEIRHHTSSWPRGLGFSADDATGGEGLAVAFGWHSQPGFATSLIERFQNFYARAYDYAGQSAWVLANVILLMQRFLPGKRIDLFCHSLGSRLVIRALALLAKHRPEAIPATGQVVILGGAEYAVEAQLMMRRILPLGAPHLPAFYNIVSRENDVLDILAENFGPRTFGNSQVIGHNGLDIECPGDHWIDLQIDSRKLESWMQKEHGLTISGDQPNNVWDHWYYYTFRGNMELYKSILRQREHWHIPALRQSGIPDGVSRRWSIFGN